MEISKNSSLATLVEVSDERTPLVSSSTQGSFSSLYTCDLKKQSEIEIDSREPSLLSKYRGQLYMAIASFLFSYMHLGTKFLGDDNIPVPEMILFRTTLLTIICYIYSKVIKVPHGFFGPPHLRPLLIARGILGYLGLLFFMLSVTMLHLGDAVALSFTIPIFMVFLAIFMLGEKSTVFDVVSIVCGIIGVIFISQPESIFGLSSTPVAQDPAKLALGLTFAFASTITNGFGNVLVRKIGSGAHSLHIVGYFTFIPIVPCLITCAYNYDTFIIPQTAWTWWCLFFMSISAFIGQMFFSESLKIEAVNKVTPIIFLQVIFAFINDWVIFNFSPPVWSLAGALFIASSVYASTIGK